MTPSLPRVPVARPLTRPARAVGGAAGRALLPVVTGATGLAQGPVPAGFTGERLGVCNLCEAICGLRLTLEDGVVTGVRGNEEDPLSRGHVCPKGVALPDIHADPDRLRRPVRRVGEGGDARWEELSWDEALDLVADGVAGAVNAHGDDALAVYLGNPNVHSLGAMTHGTAMTSSFRTRNKFSATSVDQLPAQLMAWAMFGHQLLVPVPDLDRTDLLVVLGANPMASNGSLMTAPDFPGRVRELKARGGRMVVLDPRRTETAKIATEHHFVRPGTDAFVLLAMLHVLFAERLTSPPSYAVGLELVEAAVREFTPELAQERSGVPAETIRGLARDLAGTERACVYGRMGISTQEFGTLCQWAITCLNLLAGHLDSAGGAMFTSPAVDVVDGLLGPGHLDRWRSRVRDLPEFAGELPVAVLREEIETPGEGQVRALLTLSGNPVLSTPDGGRLGEALARLDFYAAVDLFVNETTRHAHVILPPTTALERDHYDLIFHALAVRNTARFTPAVLAADPDSRHDWQIFRDLTARITARLDRPRSRRRRLATAARLRTSPTVLVAALLAAGRTGASLRALRRSPSGIDLGPLEPRLPERLRTPDHRVHTAPELVLADLDRLRAAPPVTEGDELLLVGRRHQRDNNSWMHNSARLVRGKPRHQLLCHPDDLAARGLADGDRVRVTSRTGAVEVEVRTTDEVMPGVVSLPHGYGHQRPGVRLSRASEVLGVSVNDLTDPERLDVASGNAAFSGLPVRVGPVTTTPAAEDDLSRAPATPAPTPAR